MQHASRMHSAERSQGIFHSFLTDCPVPRPQGACQQLCGQHQNAAARGHAQYNSLGAYLLQKQTS